MIFGVRAVMMRGTRLVDMLDDVPTFEMWRMVDGFLEDVHHVTWRGPVVFKLFDFEESRFAGVGAAMRRDDTLDAFRYSMMGMVASNTVSRKTMLANITFT